MRGGGTKDALSGGRRTRVALPGRLSAASAPSLPPANLSFLAAVISQIASSKFIVVAMARSFALLALLSVAAALQAPVTKVAPIARSGVRR